MIRPSFSNAPMTAQEQLLDARLRDAWHELSAAYQAVSAMRGSLRQHDQRGLKVAAERLMHRIEAATAAFEAANQAYRAMRALTAAEGAVQ